jgi:RNA polymerase sigma-70 factor (ECF subfamily)
MSEPSPQSQPLAETVRRVAETVVPPTDGQLWERVRADLADLAALTELYRRWRSPLVLLAYRCGVSAERAEEVVNDAFVRMLRRRERIESITRAFAYLRRCVERKCWRAYRAEQRRAERERTADTMDTTAAPTNGDPVARTELAAAVRAALDGLSPQQRLAAELHYLVGWPESQVAEAMGVKPSTVKEHLDRARALLRELLAKWNPTAAAGGAVAVGDVLADATRASALPPDRLSAAVSAIVARVAEAGGRAKFSLVLAGVLALGGAAAAGWALTRPAEPEQGPKPAPAPAVFETLQAKNLRIFDHEVRPKLVGTLTSLALGEGGRIKSLDARPFDTRLECVAVIEHGPPMSFESTLNIIFDTHKRHGRMRIDLLSNGRWGDLNTTQPLYWDNPFSGERIALKMPALNDLMPAFTAANWDDPRTDGEAAEHIEALARAAASYEGVWYFDGDATRPVRCWFERGENCGIWFTSPDGGSWWVRPVHLTIGPDGRLRGVSVSQSEGVMSPDGRRVDFPDIGHWWSRTPKK